MAAVIKFPSRTPGILSITNIELALLHRSKALECLTRLKPKWILAYHPNYADYHFFNNGVFDAFINSENVFQVVDDTSDKILGLSCLNLVPRYFSPSVSTASIDFIHVSRIQKDKNIEGFFDVVSEAFASNPGLTGILVASVPGRRPTSTDQVRQLYRRKFSRAQRANFDFLTLDYDLPFPLRTRTLASLFREARVHLNTHVRERGGRVQAYALATGLPIVSFPRLNEYLPPSARKEPVCFPGESISTLASQLNRAVDYVTNDYEFENHAQLAEDFSSNRNLSLMKSWFMARFALDEVGWCLDRDDWDIRLAKHHLGAQGPNSYSQPLVNFLEVLHTRDSFSLIQTEEQLDEEFLDHESLIRRSGRELRSFVSTQRENSIRKVRDMVPRNSARSRDERGS